MSDTPPDDPAERPAAPASVAPADATVSASDTRPPVVGGRLGRLSARATRLPWGMLLAEAFFTVAAILLALAADDWRQRREERELAQVALRNFVRELEANREELAGVRDYHDSLRVSFAAAAERSMTTQFRNIREVHPGFHGVAPAFLLESAWETALATGALRHIDYRVVHALAAVYTTQRNLDRLNDQLLASIVSPDVLGRNDIGMAARMGALYFGDVTAMERGLLHTYDQLLRELRPVVDADGGGVDTTPAAAR